MRKPLTALIVLLALVAGACGNYKAQMAAEKITPDPAALGRLEAAVRSSHDSEEGLQLAGPDLRDLSELASSVLWDVPDDVTPTDSTGTARPEWKHKDQRSSNVFVLGTVTAVERGKNFEPVAEGAPRDPVYGDYTNPRDCTTADRGCDTVHLHIRVERSYPAGDDGDTIVVGIMPGDEFVPFASAMLALGRAVFMVSPSHRARSLFDYDRTLRVATLDVGGLYTVAADGSLALPFADPKLAAASLASTPTVDRLFEKIAVERTIPLRYVPGGDLGVLERAD